MAGVGPLPHDCTQSLRVAWDRRAATIDGGTTSCRLRSPIWVAGVGPTPHDCTQSLRVAWDSKAAASDGGTHSPTYTPSPNRWIRATSSTWTKTTNQLTNQPTSSTTPTNTPPPTLHKQQENIDKQMSIDKNEKKDGGFSGPAHERDDFDEERNDGGFSGPAHEREDLVGQLYLY